jgi:hypothetical protein
VKPSGREIADIIVQTLKASGQSVNYEAEIFRVLTTDYKLSPAVAAEHAEKVSSAVQIRLQQVQQSQKARGLAPEFQVSEFDARYLVPLDSYKPGHAAVRSEILKLLKAAPWKKFESACCKLLELSQCTKSDIGAGTKEGGLDFYGLMHIATLAPAKKMLFDWRVRVFGQAKHWGKKAGEGDLRTFNDQVLEFAHRLVGTAYKKAPEWFRSDKSPVLGVFVGLEGFTKGARDVANRNGILTRDGEQVAEFFANAVTAGEITLGEIKAML